VHITVSEQGDDVILEVEDEGPGLPEEQFEQFEPFRRGAGVAHLPGQGLGLALVTHIARAYGGQASFRQGPSTGACLQVRLPVVRSAMVGLGHKDA
jgi:signal transduction histidine kinase